MTLNMEKAMAPNSSTLAWKTHGRRSLVGYRPWGVFLELSCFFDDPMDIGNLTSEVHGSHIVEAWLGEF